MIQTHIFCLKINVHGLWFGTVEAALAAVEEQRQKSGRVWAMPHWVWETNPNPSGGLDSRNWQIRIRRVVKDRDLILGTRDPFEYRIERHELLSPRGLSDLAQDELEELTVEVDKQWARGVGKP